MESEYDENDYSCVYHVGDLESGRVKPDRSLEGDGLSVSHVPKAWIKIARLGGLSVYRLTKQNPNFYIATSESNEKALQWCIDEGYLVARKKYRAYTTDEEGEEWFSEFDSKRDAEKEVEDEKVREIDGYSFGPKGRAYWKKSFTGKIENARAEDFAVIFFAEKHNYDGVWWHEQLDVHAFSAPRGVIFQHKLPEWKIELDK